MQKQSGNSTDGEGFYRAVLDIDPSYDLKKPVLIIGAGGAARAVAFTLDKHGLKYLYLANRTMKKAEVTAEVLVKNTKLKKLPNDYPCRIRTAGNYCQESAGCLLPAV